MMKKNLLLLIVFCLILGGNKTYAQKWVTTWCTAEQLVETNNLPPSPGLSGNSLRQIVQVSIGGETIRLKLSNEFSADETNIKAVEIALAQSAGKSSDVDESTTKSVTFDGKEGVTMAAGETAVSDALEFHLSPRDNVAITIHYGTCSNTSVTGHPGSRTTSYLAKGNTTSFANATKTEHWCTIWAIDVVNDNPQAVAVLGNSITDGRGSTTNGQDRWCDAFSRRLLDNESTANVAVLNLGVGGNCVLSGGLGVCVKERYQRDLFGQEGVKYIILFEAVNDLGYASDGVATANNIIGVYKQIIQEAHNKGILVYGATITPFKNSSYFSESHEKGRQTLNDWIRNGGYTDGTIDFDKAVRGSSDTLALNTNYLFQDDWLHLNAKGYQAMADAIDLSLFSKEYANEVPFVYDVENTGASFKAPTKKAVSSLPKIESLPDPFLFTDGTRSIHFNDWSHHRNDIIKYLEYYEIGEKPSMDGCTFTATLSGTTLNVKVTASNGQSLTVKGTITYPTKGTAPYPALIGISNCLPTSLFTDQGCALINFDYSTVCAYSQTRGSEPINKLYPSLKDNGAYSFWAWGISRLIDGLQQLGDAKTKIDTRHLAVSGCSWAGKAALFAGALDERIALVIPQESGGGGVSAWRVNETLGDVERVGSTDGTWFMQSMKNNFSGTNVSKMPTDHHELAALVAPRAILILGNPPYTWLAEESGYVSSQAVRAIYRTLGIEDRAGFAIEGGHDHCSLPSGEYQYVTAFIKRFLLDQSDVDTDITVCPTYQSVNHERWYQWWGTNDSSLPTGDVTDGIWIEAERMTEGGYGSNFKKVADKTASNGYYMLTNKNTTSLNKTKANTLQVTFDIPTSGTYYFYARLKCTSYDDDSYFISIDNGDFSRSNGLYTGDSWQWKELIQYVDDGSSPSRTLSAGTHTFTIAGREDGAQFDKLCITSANFAPTEMGEDDPVVTGIGNIIITERETGTDEIFNLQGARVDNNYKGIIIKNGKKELRR